MPRESPAAIDGEPARVLVVDDEQAVQTASRRALERAGYAVDVASDGETAVRQVEQTSYDAILSDIGMPGMSGIDLLRAVRAHDLDVPVLLITGGPTIQTAARAVELGAFRYLLKPFDVQDLTDVVRRAVTTHRLARLKREAQEHLEAGAGSVGDLAGLEVRLVNALKTLWMAYQPVRDVHVEPIKQRLIRSMVGLARDLDITVIAEGVENQAERDTLIECGCDWLQGFLFARPGRPFPTPEL